MHLRSIAMKGFKSFPSRTKLEFGPGVVRDRRPERLGQVEHHRRRALGARRAEPAGDPRADDEGRDLRRRPRRRRLSSAEVEVVIDNSDGALPTDFSEISIVRKLGRDGEGEYRLNGARCRLVDVLEVLSDSGLGKEMHSVVSQGKVEQIVLSRPARAAPDDRGGRRARQAPQAPPPRPAQAGAHRGEPVARARRGARGALAAAPAEAPGRGRRAARADRAPVARGPHGAGGRRCARRAGPRSPRRRRVPSPPAPSATRPSGCSPRWPRGARRPSARSPTRAGSASRSRPGASTPAPPPSASGCGSSGYATRPPPPRSGAGGARSSWRSSSARPRRPRGARAELPDDELPRPPEDGDHAARTAWDALTRASGYARSSASSAVSTPTPRSAAAASSPGSSPRWPQRVRAPRSSSRRSATVAARSTPPNGGATRPRPARREAERALEAARSRAADAGAELAALNRLVRGAGSAPGRRARARGGPQGGVRLRARPVRGARRPAHGGASSRTSRPGSGCSTRQTTAAATALDRLARPRAPGRSGARGRGHAPAGARDARAASRAAGRAAARRRLGGGLAAVGVGLVPRRGRHARGAPARRGHGRALAGPGRGR